MNRHPDGRYRGRREPVAVSAAVLRSRWIESETVQLKRMGLAFDAIATRIMRIAEGHAPAIAELPTGVTFPPNYRISRQAVHKAFRRALAREPVLAVEELRKLDMARSEEMFMNLQPAIRKGNSRAIEVGLRLLDHSARIHGYAAPRRHELTGKDGQPLTLVQLLEAVGPLEEDEEKD